VLWIVVPCRTRKRKKRGFLFETSEEGNKRLFVGGKEGRLQQSLHQPGQEVFGIPFRGTGREKLG